MVSSPFSCAERREHGFDRLGWEARARGGSIARDVGTCGFLRRGGFASERKSARKLEHRLLLEALGLKLDRLDPGAKELGRTRRNERGRRFERTPHGAQRNDGRFPPGSDALLDGLDLGRGKHPPACRLPEQKQEKIDIDPRLVLKRNAGICNAGLTVEAKREPPERRRLRRRSGRAIAHGRAPNRRM